MCTQAHFLAYYDVFKMEKLGVVFEISDRHYYS